MDITLARTPKQLDAAAEFLFTQYHNHKIIQANEGRRHQSEHSRSGPASVFLAAEGGAVVGTVSAFLDGSIFGLPANKVYAKELNLMGLYGLKLVEVGELAHTGASLLELLRFAYWFAVHVEADWIIATVHPKHAKRYTRLAGFEVCGPKRSILNGCPSVLIRMSVDTRVVGLSPPWKKYWIDNPLCPNEVLR